MDMLASVHGKHVSHVSITTSGLHAISSTVASLITPETLLVVGSELYSDTLPTLKRLVPESKLLVCPVNTPKLMAEFFEEHKSRFSNDANVLLFLESCSNPSGFIPDWDFLATKLRAAIKNLTIVVDNTFLSNEIFNPFQVAAGNCADVVVYSLTKYHSGGSCILGASLFRDAKMGKAHQTHLKFQGIHVSPLHCEMVADKMLTMRSRILKTSAVTEQLLAWTLDQKFKGAEVLHAGSATHPSHELMKKHFRKDTSKERKPLHYAILTLIVPKTAIECKQIMKDTLAFKTSYGAALSSFCPFVKRLEPGLTRCRLAIGYESELDSLQKAIKSLLE